MVNIEIKLILFFPAKDGEILYSQQKQDQELAVKHKPWTPYCQIQTEIEESKENYKTIQFSSVQPLSHVWLFATPWTAAR